MRKLIALAFISIEKAVENFEGLLQNKMYKKKKNEKL